VLTHRKLFLLFNHIFLFSFFFPFSPIKKIKFDFILSHFIFAIRKVIYLLAVQVIGKSVELIVMLVGFLSYFLFFHFFTTLFPTFIINNSYKFAYTLFSVVITDRSLSFSAFSTTFFLTHKKRSSLSSKFLQRGLTINNRKFWRFTGPVEFNRRTRSTFAGS
jgi:hypothetical protein